MALDPNETLERLRQLSGNAKGHKDGYEITEKAIKEFGELFIKLDLHLLEGGALPDGWALSKFSKSK